MNHRTFLVALISCTGAVAGAADTVNSTKVADDQLRRIAVDYTLRMEEASKELLAARARIMGERTPLADAARAQESRVRALESEIEGMGAAVARASGEKKVLEGEWEAASRNISFLRTQARDILNSVQGALLPGEEQELGGPIAELQRALEDGSQADTRAALDVIALAVKHVERSAGGRAAPGTVLRSGENRLERGRFAFFGPEVYFRNDAGDLSGIVRPREGSPYPIVYPIAEWTAADAGGFFEGRAGTIVADVSGGKALRLRESEVTFFETIQQAGNVGYVIIALGLLSVTITLLKLLDIRELKIDTPAAVQRVTGALARGARTEAESTMHSLARTTRELFATGLRYADGPRALLEENLEGFLMRQRLHHERRLPLLAVIATAGPLLGLLGTVTGMIKTFTLITVFGSGSATRLSSGISEALVATELGLAVAIPTLVIHGFLSHRIQKGLSMVERYALEFVTAVEESRVAGAAPVTKPK